MEVTPKQEFVSNLTYFSWLKLQLKKLPFLGYCLQCIWSQRRYVKHLIFLLYKQLPSTFRRTLRLLYHLQKVHPDHVDFYIDLLRLLKVHPDYVDFYIDLFRSYIRLQFLLKDVELYQPLYGCNLLNVENTQPKRTCVQRADTVYQQIKMWGQHARILDIGCSLGYFSYHFAERGYLVDGIDNLPENIEICQLLKSFNKSNANFSVANFSPEYIRQIKTQQYDIVFLFSVIHHIINTEGLSYAQDLMAQLLEKVPILFVELAVKTEQTNYSWVENLPDDELVIFEKCKNISITKLGNFSTHISSVERPLYLVEKNILHVDGVAYKIHKRKFVSWDSAPYQGCYFYDCDDVYIKQFLLNRDTGKLDIQAALKEINNYQLLPQNEFFPALVSVEQQTDSMILMFSKLGGETVHDLLARKRSIPALQIFNETVAALKFLHQHSLYHNDIRLWNIMFNGEKTFLIDLGSAKKEEAENTNLALLWVIAQLHQFVYCVFSYPLTTAPNFEKITLQPPFVSIVNALQATNDFGKFLEWFTSTEHKRENNSFG